MPTIVATKLVVSLVVFLSGLLSVLLPMCVVGTSDVAFSVGNMMASGVLLSAGLVHQLADSAATLDAPGGYPWSMFLAGLTFIAFLVFEESLHLLLSGGHDHREGTEEAASEAPSDRGLVTTQRSCRGSVVIAPECEVGSGASGHGLHRGQDHSHGHGHSHDHAQGDGKDRSLLRKTSSTYSEERYQRISGAVEIEDGSRPSLLPAQRVGVHHHHDDHISAHLHGSFLASLVLLLALSVHSVLEGLSVGLANDAGSITSTAVAVVAHKAFAGYALGSAMASAEVGTERHASLGLVFAFSAPLGILIGMVLSLDAYDEDSGIVAAIKAVVAGTFLYVSIVELGMKELLVCRHDDASAGTVDATVKRTEAAKLFAFFAGFLAMSSLPFFI